MLANKKQDNIVQILDSMPLHVAKLKMNLRIEDVHEVLRLGISVQKALWLSYRESLIRKSALIDGEIAAMWGAKGNIMSQEGTVWLLTSPQIKKVSPLQFARIYQSQVYEMLKLFPCLVNYCDASYTNAIRLLEIIGFTIYDPEPIGKDGAMFRKFKIERA